MKPITVGQIGIGHNHGKRKMETVRRHPELFEVIGYAESDPKWLEERGSLPQYEGLPRLSEEELLEKCEAILVECDVWNLTATAQRCINAGKHIHLDKPASGTLAEYRRLLDSAKAKNLVVQLGYMYRYNPAIRWCMDAVRDGRLGTVTSINAEMSTFHKPEYRRWLQNFDGGIQYILGSHLVDLIVGILGEPDRVTSFLKHTGTDGVDASDNNLSVLEYGSTLARVFVSSVEVNGWGRRQFVVCGTKGTVHIEPIENTTKLIYSDLDIAVKSYEDLSVEIPVEDVPKELRYEAMMKDFYAFVREGKKNPWDYDYEYTVQKVLYDMIGRK